MAGRGFDFRDDTYLYREGSEEVGGMGNQLTVTKLREVLSYEWSCPQHYREMI